MGTQGPVFGPSSRGVARPGQPYGDGIATAYKKPGFLSHEPRQPAYTFGGKRRDLIDSNPGPAAYNPVRANTAPTSGWGPPPRSLRPASAPRQLIEERPVAKAKGPSFGTARRPERPDPTPGPQDYQCRCAGHCCKACDTYSGVTFKGRRPLFYGKVTTVTPGPAGYHNDCSTIGVATAACASGPQGTMGHYKLGKTSKPVLDTFVWTTSQGQSTRRY
jgi:hypothetical protein